jgi:hypothetical protein
MRTIDKAILFLTLAPLSICWGQATKVTIQEQGSEKAQQIDNQIFIGCTNGGDLHLAGQVRVAVAIDTCGERDSGCKADSEKLTTGAHVRPGELLGVYCTTKAEDAQSARDDEFCRNAASNPRPDSQADMNKHNAEYLQCRKDRAESRRKK